LLASLSTVSSSDILAPVAADMETMNRNLRAVVGDRHPMLVAAADQIFAAGGKRLRPALVFLVARATSQLMGARCVVGEGSEAGREAVEAAIGVGARRAVVAAAESAREPQTRLPRPPSPLLSSSDIEDKHRRLAEITEMIHTASLMHDDVLDECSTRRGAATVNSTYGTRVAVLVGDFLFAQSSWFLARLENLEVIKLISQVIADFANGEISQAAALFDTDATLAAYLDKSFYKTATLIAASCRGAAVFSGCGDEVKDAMFEYGRRLGLAFQVVDDVLDFTAPAELLGKPRGQDLASGNLTAPAVYALAHPSLGPELRSLIESEFADAGDLDRALELVGAAGGLDAARALARSEADAARAALACLPDGDAKRSLELMVEYVLDRLY
jgi:all-trans-nonaprenyl-diphosphate synthase